jgi:HEAT repeat protein
MKIWLVCFVVAAITVLALSALNNYFAVRKSVPELMATVRDETAPLDARLAAVKALGMTRDDRQIPLMIELLSGRAPASLKYLATMNLATLESGNVSEEMRPPSESVFRRNEKRYVNTWLNWWEKEGRNRFFIAFEW